MTFRYLTSGESHGKSLCAIIEGMVSGLDIDVDLINEELKRRQQGKGRGGRMKIESDTVEILSGVRFSKTTGAPISLIINNKDFENWVIPMSVNKVDLSNDEIKKLVEEKSISAVRPGHADLSGALKYDLDDVRDVLERSSARETATRVAIGSIAKQFLSKFGVEVNSKILSYCGVNADDETSVNEKFEQAKNDGNTFGGLVEVNIKGVVPGLGSYVNWDRKLDGLLAQAVMSVGAIKSVEFGLGKKCAELFGSDVHDEIFLENGNIKRNTNNAGGIEGGMSNGEPIVLTMAMKPIPTMRKPLQSFDLKSKQPYEAHFERSDTCALEACAVVLEAMCAICIANEYLKKFGGDSIKETMANYKSYVDGLRARLS